MDAKNESISEVETTDESVFSETSEEEQQGPQPPQPPGEAAPGQPHYTGTHQQQPPVTEGPRRASFRLPGAFESLPRSGFVGLIDGLLKKPANVAYEITQGNRTLSRLLAVSVVCMLVTGFVVGSFAGGFQLLAVPAKLALGFVLAAVMCLPSLYILNCLSGSELSLRQVFGAQLMGIATVGILLLGFAPIGWVFSQSTSSPVFMGVMYLIFFALSCAFGLTLMKRVIGAMGGRPFKQAWLWNIVFVLVVLQLSTTLRPLFGDYEGLALGDKLFFLEHWFDTMSPSDSGTGWVSKPGL